MEESCPLSQNVYCKRPRLCSLFSDRVCRNDSSCKPAERGTIQEAQARRELLPKAGVAKHSVASRLSLKMRTSCFSHGRHRGNKDTNTTAVRFEHPRGSHDPRNDRTRTQVDISKFHTGLAVFLQFPIVAFGRSCNAGRKPSHQCRMRLIPGLAEL